MIRARDEKLLGSIISRRSQQTGPVQIPLSARDLSEQPRQETAIFECVVPLTREAINHVERQRETDKKRDVQFLAEVEVPRLNLKVSPSQLSANEPFNVRNAFPNLGVADPKRSVVTNQLDRDYK